MSDHLIGDTHLIGSSKGETRERGKRNIWGNSSQWYLSKGRHASLDLKKTWSPRKIKQLELLHLDTSNEGKKLFPGFKKIRIFSTHGHMTKATKGCISARINWNLEGRNWI